MILSTGLIYMSVSSLEVFLKRHLVLSSAFCRNFLKVEQSESPRILHEQKLQNFFIHKNAEVGNYKFA